MDLSFLVYINIFIFVLVFVLLFAVLLLYFKIHKTYEDEGRLMSADKKLKGELAKKFEDIANKRVEQILGEAALEIEKNVKKQVGELVEVSSRKAQEIGDFVEKQQQEQVKESQFYVANMLSKIEKEAEEYRKNKLLKVDEEIRQIVLSAAREVIGRAISLSEHEDLVTKALERAKREKLFV